MIGAVIHQASHELTEPEAIRRAQAGDSAAFEFLYKSHSSHVYSVCMKMLKNPSDAEDLTQQVFIQLFRKIGSFRGDSRFSTWLHRVAVNAVLMHMRRRKPTDMTAGGPETTDATEDARREFDSADTSMLGAIERMNLMRAIRKLPAGSKRLFVLHDVLGFKHSEIAARLGCTEGCSKSQVHRARKRLRRLLFGDPSEARTDAAAPELA